MRKCFVLALIVAGAWLTGPAVADAQLSGTWDLTFSTAPDPLELVMVFVEVTPLFTGHSFPPSDCTWVGIRLPISRQSSLVTGVMSCGEPSFIGFLFGTSMRTSMTGILIAPLLSPPAATFDGTKQRG